MPELTSGAADSPLIGDVGESGVVAALAEVFTPVASTQVGIGDDAAVVRLADPDAVITTDMLIERLDFFLDYMSWHDVGWKSAAVNLSDIGAMGAQPRALVLSVGLPRRTRLADVVAFAEGVRDACAELAPDCAVVGGDLSDADRLIVSVTAIGSVPPGLSPILRSTARPGDVVAYCGQLGQSAAGLAYLLARHPHGPIPDPVALDSTVARAVRAHVHPEPPVAQGVVANASGATAMLDVSDGLARDAGRIATASEVTIELDQRVLPAVVGALNWSRFELGADPWELVLGGGEDFGLLATFPRADAVPESFRIIGQVQERGAETVTLSGRAIAYGGWDHFTHSD